MTPGTQSMTTAELAALALASDDPEHTDALIARDAEAGRLYLEWIKLANADQDAALEASSGDIMALCPDPSEAQVRAHGAFLERVRALAGITTPEQRAQLDPASEWYPDVAERPIEINSIVDFRGRKSMRYARSFQVLEVLAEYGEALITQIGPERGELDEGQMWVPISVLIWRNQVGES